MDILKEGTPERGGLFNVFEDSQRGNPADALGGARGRA